MKKEWKRRVTGQYNLPEAIIPEFQESLRCRHGRPFDEEDENLVKLTNNIIIVTEHTETIRSICTYGRRTVDPEGHIERCQRPRCRRCRRCRCVQKADTHKYLLWHVGQGKMFCYQTLKGEQKYLNKLSYSDRS